MAEKLRYSDEELEEFRQLINTKLEKATAEYEYWRNIVKGGDGSGTSDTSRTFNAMEDSANVRDRENAARFAERQRKFIGHLQAALVRIENKTYGICRATGKLIPKERLRAVPHATLSIDQKENKR